MIETNKDKHEFLKIKLDFIKQFFTTFIVLDAGLFGFLFLNFENNSTFLNFRTICGIILISSVFALLIKNALGILKEMKGLLWFMLLFSP